MHWPEPEQRRNPHQRPGPRRSACWRSPPPAVAREREVLTCIAQEPGNHTIADRMRPTAKTISNHRSTIYAKLGAPNRVEAADRACQAGLGRWPPLRPEASLLGAVRQAHGMRPAPSDAMGTAEPSADRVRSVHDQYEPDLAPV
ncbi:LuxR C-terminal-related transcriptional regulator [Dactylosporangium sp. NPDC049742]|uniref:response regulator transcription factor n=1 Tax=Dactylosporangium sp. NPDC049742 TaxID=3154737 RepID=UPI0034395D56